MLMDAGHLTSVFQQAQDWFKSEVETALYRSLGIKASFDKKRSQERIIYDAVWSQYPRLVDPSRSLAQQRESLRHRWQVS